MGLGNGIATELMEVCRVQTIRSLQQTCGADHQMRELRRTPHSQIYSALNWVLYTTLCNVLHRHSV